MNFIIRSVMTVFSMLILIQFSFAGHKVEKKVYKAQPVVNRFAEYASKEFELDSVKLEEKDPVTAATLSFLMPGGGFYYLGKPEMGTGFLIAETLLSIGTGVVINITNEGVGGFAIVAGVVVRYVVLNLVEMIWVSAEADGINDRYYKQLLCPNSPFKIKDKTAYEERSPGLAFVLAAFTFPGVGNYYAGNNTRGTTLLTASLIGSSLFLLAKPFSDAASWGSNTELSWQGMGIAILCIAKLTDMISAPWYAAIQNDLHKAINADGKVSLLPSVIENKPGIKLLYEF